MIGAETIFLSKCNVIGRSFISSLHDKMGAEIEPEPKHTQTQRGTLPIDSGGKLPKLVRYLPLLVPIILFLGSQYISPLIFIDSSMGFLALRSMLEGGAFNSITVADPANIANDVAIFLTWWSPGQYLVPGSFIWLGTSYGLAVSLTTLIATLIGVAGWIQVARSFAVSSFVLFVFVLGLNTFPYVTHPFLMYWGGELLLFAAAPWSLYAMRWAANKPPIVCFTISLLSAALLFFAKLTGLVVFASNVIAISLVALANQRRLDSSTIAMWVASAIGALCFMVFWVARGQVAEHWSTFSFSWFPMWLSVAAAAFSGIYGLGLFLAHPWMQINFEWAIELLAAVGLLLMVWVWNRLRHTRYRDMAVLLLAIILIYAITVATTFRYLRGISFEDRHFRYAGILFFLLLLTAADQWRAPLAKGLACLVVIVLGLYGLRNYTTFAYAQMRTGYYDPTAGISQAISPAVLEYLRSEVRRHNFQRPIAVIATPSAAISLPTFRIIIIGWEQQPSKWAGRAEKIFVVVPEELLKDETEVILRAFTDYEFDNWSQMKLGGMIIYSQ
jgi:hypothetical protein